MALALSIGETVIETFVGYHYLIGGWGDPDTVKVPPKAILFQPICNALRKSELSLVDATPNDIHHGFKSGMHGSELLYMEDRVVLERSLQQKYLGNMHLLFTWHGMIDPIVPDAVV